jgi:hypothetical protein
MTSTLSELFSMLSIDNHAKIVAYNRGISSPGHRCMTLILRPTTGGVLALAIAAIRGFWGLQAFTNKAVVKSSANIW